MAEICYRRMSRCFTTLAPRKTNKVHRTNPRITKRTLLVDYERVDQLLRSPSSRTGLKKIFKFLVLSLAHTRVFGFDIKIEIAPIMDYLRLTHRSPDNGFSIRHRIASITFDRNESSLKVTFQTTKSWKKKFFLDRVHLRIHFTSLSRQSCLFCMREFEKTIKMTQTASPTFTNVFVKRIFTFGFSHRVAIESVDRRLLVVARRVEIVTRSVHALVQCCWRRDHFIHFHLSPRNILLGDTFFIFIHWVLKRQETAAVNRLRWTRQEWVQNLIFRCNLTDD